MISRRETPLCWPGRPVARHDPGSLDRHALLHPQQVRYPADALDPKKPGKPRKLPLTLGLRAATAETPRGIVYTVSQSGKGGETILYAFDVKKEQVRNSVRRRSPRSSTLPRCTLIRQGDTSTTSLVRTAAPTPMVRRWCSTT